MTLKSRKQKAIYPKMFEKWLVPFPIPTEVGLFFGIFVNMFAHADYFSEIHSTVRTFDNRIQFQNTGGFSVNLDVVGTDVSVSAVKS